MKKINKGRVKKFERRNPEIFEPAYSEELAGSKDYTPARKKKKIRVNKTRIFLIVLALALIIVLGFSLKNIYDLRQEQKELVAQNKTLTEQKAQLKDELKNVNDKNYIEEQARIQLRLVKPGEILYILEDDKTNSSNKDDGNN